MYVLIVISQVEPDPDFPTVRYPNPEEGKSALVSFGAKAVATCLLYQDLAIGTAERHDCSIIIANDPDADRLAVAEYNMNGYKEWRVFSGNELGSLLAWWAWMNFRREHPHIDGWQLCTLSK